MTIGMRTCALGSIWPRKTPFAALPAVFQVAALDAKDAALMAKGAARASGATGRIKGSSDLPVGRGTPDAQFDAWLVLEIPISGGDEWL